MHKLHLQFDKHREEEQKPPEEEEEDEEFTSYSSEEELSDAEEHFLQLLVGPRSPPNNQALAMPLPLRKKEEKDESTAVVKNLQF